MSTDIDKWLAEREQQTSQELARLDHEAAKQRAVLEWIRRTRAEAATLGVNGSAPAADSGQVAPTTTAGEPGFESMPDFDEASTKRKIIWQFLDARRGTPYRNGELHRELIAQGAIPPNTPESQIEVTTRRMLNAKPPQIAKAGRGQIWLPPKDHRPETLLGGDDG